jgi:hypothetical protein
MAFFSFLDDAKYSTLFGLRDQIEVLKKMQILPGLGRDPGRI